MQELAKQHDENNKKLFLLMKEAGCLSIEDVNLPKFKELFAPSGYQVLWVSKVECLDAHEWILKIRR